MNIRVSGKVQGVFFRASTQREANRLNISGFVRNEEDGSVYIEAEGPEDKLEAFVAWCHRGPERARVDKCEVVDGEIIGFEGFEVRR